MISMASWGRWTLRSRRGAERLFELLGTAFLPGGTFGNLRHPESLNEAHKLGRWDRRSLSRHSATTTRSTPSSQNQSNTRNTSTKSYFEYLKISKNSDS